MRRRTTLAPEPSRLRRAATFVRRWIGQSAWRALATIAVLGAVAGAVLVLTIQGPFWQQVSGSVVFVTVFFVVFSWFDDGTWRRAIVFGVLVAPTPLLIFLLPQNDAAFEDATGFTEAHRSGYIPARSGCMGVYVYDVGGKTYRTLLSSDRCPRFAMLQYVVDRPWRVRRQPEGVGPPPPPAPPPGAAR